jgi:hypothetical protein
LGPGGGGHALLLQPQVDAAVRLAVGAGKGHTGACDTGGPYYSNSGRIYGYNEVTRSLMQQPQQALVTQSFTDREH